MLSPLGFRVIDIISPYHGLRTQAGTYGGEPFFAAAPLGTLDLIVGMTSGLWGIMIGSMLSKLVVSASKPPISY